jgi:hypothetical protein
MIANLDGYQISKSRVNSFQDAPEHFDQQPPEGDPVLVQVQRDLIASKLEDLLEDIQAFEALSFSPQ